MMMVTICPLETWLRVLNSANSGAGSKNDQVWVCRSKYHTRVRVAVLDEIGEGLFRVASDDVHDLDYLAHPRRIFALGRTQASTV